MSLPTRERELKPLQQGVSPLPCPSLPTRERELKLVHAGDLAAGVGSLPTRERELKPKVLQILLLKRSRSLHGSVN